MQSLLALNDGLHLGERDAAPELMRSREYNSFFPRFQSSQNLVVIHLDLLGIMRHLDDNVLARGWFNYFTHNKSPLLHINLVCFLLAHPHPSVHWVLINKDIT